MSTKAFTSIDDAAAAAGSAALAAAIASGAEVADSLRVSSAASDAVLALQQWSLVWVPLQEPQAFSSGSLGVAVDERTPIAPVSGKVAVTTNEPARRWRRPPQRVRRRQAAVSQV